MTKRTNINLNDEDCTALECIRKYHGFTSEIAVIRFVLHKEAKAIQREGLKESKRSSVKKEGKEAE